MTKSKTWKKHRDMRRDASKDENLVELDELSRVVMAPWSRGWCDHHVGNQIAYATLIRPDVDELNVAEWPVYAGWGGSGALIPRRAVEEAREIIANNPPPRLMNVEELKKRIEFEAYFLKVAEEPPGRFGKNPKSPELAEGSRREIARLQGLIVERGDGSV